MCGIGGEVHWDGLPDESCVREIAHRLRHRGPDDFGLWRSQDKRCVLGHTRLSVVDLSPAGHQPMIDPLTGNAIVFNGEIYNFLDRRAECEKRGDRFHSHTDTEVILALYRRFGTDCLRYLRGMFAFAIWDPGNQTLFLARDRVGKKPLLYALTNRGAVFASEISPLTAHPAVSTAIDEEALELYLQLQYIPAPWTIYRSIRKLPPAHFALVTRRGMDLQQYWEVDYRPKVKMTEAEALEGLSAKLREAVRLRLIADVPVGALLSGGVDSGLVVAHMAVEAPGRPRTFTIGFKEERHNELPYAQFVADRCGTDHHPELVATEVEGLLPTIVRHYGEPYADSSAVPSFQVCRAARRHVTVALNGDGGDELLGGYGRYSLPRGLILTGSLLGKGSSAERMGKLVGRVCGPHFTMDRLQREWYLRLANPELRSLLRYASNWNDSKRARLLGREARRDDGVLPTWRITQFRQAMRLADNPIDRMLQVENRSYLSGDLLVKMDIASMHCGLETRSPLLDHEVIEYCAALPVGFKVRDRNGKYLLKRLAERHFPRDFLSRRKMGFGVPLAEWLRGPLRPLAEEVLADPMAMDPLKSAVIREVASEFFEGGVTGHDSRLWILVMYGLWRRHAYGSRQWIDLADPGVRGAC
jgi:asparagine synthase (glutamine-hydrolysing)